MTRIYILFGLLLLSVSVFTQNREKAFALNEKLGRGINNGNMFEAPSETSWGNPWYPQYAKIEADMGFKHVRIPVRWEPSERSLAASPYTIYPSFLNRIKQVVDSTLSHGMYAIINMHHHEDLYENPDNQKERFLGMWEQIADFFKDYPDSLIFEVLNEPHGNLSATKWNVFLDDALKTIRVTNPERIVLIGVAEYGGLAGLSKLQLPDDENIILTLHYYNPFQFTHQGAEWSDGSEDWLGTEWNDTKTERQTIQNDFAPLKAYEEQHKIPIHIGEFGAYYKADIASRERWTTYLARYFESLNWSWAYWEFSAGFGVYDKTAGTYNREIFDALMNNPMPEPAEYVGTPIYTSNFPQTISDWNLSNQGGAQANKLQSNDKLEVEISQKGTSGWHIQLVKNNIVLEAGKKYRLSFKAKASENRSISAYVGRASDPWTAYSGYNGIALSDTFSTFSIVFDMNSTDNIARIAFDLGSSNVDVVFESIVLETVELQFPVSAEIIKKFNSHIYPNPVDTHLHIDNRDDFQELSIYSTKGTLLRKQKLHPFLNTTSVNQLASGMYFVTLSNQQNRHTIKMYKK